MAENTVDKIQKEAKKRAIILYKKIFDEMYNASLAISDLKSDSPEFFDAELFSKGKSFDMAYEKIKEVLDKLTEIPETVEPELPKEEEVVHPVSGPPFELASEVNIENSNDLEPVNVE